MGKYYPITVGGNIITGGGVAFGLTYRPLRGSIESVGRMAHVYVMTSQTDFKGIVSRD
jgi:hypothetical protein